MKFGNIDIVDHPMSGEEESAPTLHIPHSWRSKINKTNKKANPHTKQDGPQGKRDLKEYLPDLLVPGRASVKQLWHTHLRGKVSCP